MEQAVGPPVQFVQVQMAAPGQRIRPAVVAAVAVVVAEAEQQPAVALDPARETPLCRARSS